MGGRQASMARTSRGVLEKQLVDHLWILCQKDASFLVIWVVGSNTSAP